MSVRRRRLEYIATPAVLAALITLAACGQAAAGWSQNRPGAGGSTGIRTPPTVHTFQVPISSLRPVRLLSRSQAEKLTRLPWQLVSTQNHGRQLVILVPATGCSRLVGAAVNETPDQVAIAALGTKGPANLPCAGTGGGDLVKVQLTAPLGSRALSHQY